VKIQGDQKEGLRRLYECINSRKSARVPLSLFFIIQWYLIFIPDYVPGKTERFNEAQKLLKFAAHYFPDNILFTYLQSILETKLGNLDKALIQLDQSIIRVDEGSP
jgi:tetratricopeptide (TPR) repeat protein